MIDIGLKCFPCGDAVLKASSLNVEPFGTSETEGMFTGQIKKEKRSKAVRVW